MLGKEIALTGLIYALVVLCKDFFRHLNDDTRCGLSLL